MLRDRPRVQGNCAEHESEVHQGDRQENNRAERRSSAFRSASRCARRASPRTTGCRPSWMRAREPVREHAIEPAPQPEHDEHRRQAHLAIREPTARRSAEAKWSARHDSHDGVTKAREVNRREAGLAAELLQSRVGIDARGEAADSPAASRLLTGISTTRSASWKWYGRRPLRRADRTMARGGALRGGERRARRARWNRRAPSNATGAVATSASAASAGRALRDDPGIGSEPRNQRERGRGTSASMGSLRRRTRPGRPVCPAPRGRFTFRPVARSPAR